MKKTIRRKGECRCELACANRQFTCLSCSTLALKFLKIVLDIPEGVWYTTKVLGGDTGFEIVTMRQLEFAFSAPAPFSLGARGSDPRSESVSDLSGDDLCPAQEAV